MSDFRIDSTAFAGAIPLATDWLEKQSILKLKKSQLDIFVDVVRETPVDTAFARNGWHLEDVGLAFMIVNNVHYMIYLAQGHSKQASAGWIERIILRHV